MKRILFVIFVILLSLSSEAQKIHFTDTSNVWKELQQEYNFPLPPITSYGSYSFINDSTIDSVKYRDFGFGLVREDTILKRVYIRDIVGDTDVVLMDYNLHVGDTFVTKYNNRFAVLKIDSTLINGVWHKVWYFPIFPGGWITSMYDTTYVIEGIGCIEDPTFMITNYIGCIECMQPFMYCFSNNRITPIVSPQIAWLDDSISCTAFPTLYVNRLLPHYGQLTIFPNPTQSTLTIQSPNQPINEVTITNLLGQTVKTSPGLPKGEEMLRIDVADLPQGMYLVRINGTEVRKFVKE